jgi:hypothetical protein
LRNPHRLNSIAAIMHLRTLVIVASAGLLALASLKFFAIPYLWVFLSVAVASLWLMRGSRTPWVRALWLNFAVAVIVLGAAEVYFWNSARYAPAATYSPQGYQVRDDILGAAPLKGITARSTLAAGAATIYDVEYTIGSDGLRAPPSVLADTHGSVVFFGCSFTFGEGLDDEQAMPYRVGVLTEGLYQTRNFGFHGYGPHQMLSSVERGHLETLLDRQPTHFVYQAMPDHVARVAGLHSYQSNHPRFVLERDGSVVRKGFFADEENAAPSSALLVNIRYQLGKSFIYSRVLNGERRTKDADLQLWVAIVARSKRLIEAKYPSAEFHVLMWPWVSRRTAAEEFLAQEMTSRLTSLGIRVHPIGAILPNYDEQPERYQLSPTYDRHPSAAANDLIARYVVRSILGAPVSR